MRNAYAEASENQEEDILPLLSLLVYIVRYTRKTLPSLSHTNADGPRALPSPSSCFDHIPGRPAQRQTAGGVQT